MRLAPADLQKLASAYDLGLDEGRSKQVQEWAREQASRVHREFAKLTKLIDVEFTERDPYPSFLALAEDVRAHRRMYVYTGGSDTPLWDEKTNWMARAVHDWDHIQGGFDFSVEGELGAYKYSAARAPALAKLYLSEIALQAASSAIAGFPDGPQKLVVAGDDIQRIADRFANNGRRASGEAAAKDVQTEELALRLSRFLRPEEIALHLGAKRVGRGLGVVAAAGTKLVKRRLAAAAEVHAHLGSEDRSRLEHVVVFVDRDAEVVDAKALLLPAAPAFELDAVVARERRDHAADVVHAVGFLEYVLDLVQQLPFAHKGDRARAGHKSQPPREPEAHKGIGDYRGGRALRLEETTEAFICA